MKTIKQLSLGSLALLLFFSISCSTEENTDMDMAKTSIQTGKENLKTTGIQGVFFSDFLRFNVARRSRLCKEGWGVCTMQDKRDAIEEEKRRQEIEDEAKTDHGIYRSNSIVVPADPTDNIEDGILDVLFDRAQVLAQGKLDLDIKLAQAPTSSPVPLIVEEMVTVDISGQLFKLPAGNYQYNPALGTYGGYHITIKRD